MSELINNSEIKQKKLRKLILSLHEGRSIQSAKEEFQKEFGSITTDEIVKMEQALIKEEGLKVSDIQKLCDVHAAVFEGSISDIHNLSGDFSKVPGHPIQVFLKENDRIEQLIKEEIEPFLDQKGKTPTLMLRLGFDRLMQIDKHYTRKEQLFFPHLEKKGITAPPQVMWGVDDEIRADLKEVIADFNLIDSDESLTKEKAKRAIERVRDMIFKENFILMPLLKETLTFMNWVDADLASPEIGYFIDKPTHSWAKQQEIPTDDAQRETLTGDINFPVGSLSKDELNSMLNALPFDLTFVDAAGYVKYFTQGKERIFLRPPTVIGRHVTLCHPPGSVHIVQQIIESFRSGQKDHEDFWIKIKDSFIHIRYFAVRNEQGEFLGTLEVSQDIKPLRDLEGEKRML